MTTPTLTQQMRELNQSTELRVKVCEFANLAKCIALGRGNHTLVRQVANDSRVPFSVKTAAILKSRHAVYEMPPDEVERTKAAVSAGGTSVGDWSEALAAYQSIANAFAESLRNYGAFDRLLPSMRRVPMRTRVGVVSVGAVGGVVGQNTAKAVSRLTLTSGVIDETKVVAILAFTDELLQFAVAGTGDLFANELSNEVATKTDSQFVAVLSAGATSIPSTGVTAEGVRNDLRALLAVITTSVRSQLFLLVPSAVAKTLSVLHTTTGDAAFETMGVNGGTIAGIQVVVSDGVPANTAILVDASQVAAASDTVTLKASNEALLNLDTAPDSPAATNILVSLWQSNMTALMAERFFGVTKLNANAAAVLSNIAYVGDSPG